MTQYVIAVHNMSRDKTTYHGPYGDAEYMEYYEEINSYFKKEAEDYNCYIIELELWPEGLEEPDHDS